MTRDHEQGFEGVSQDCGTAPPLRAWGASGGRAAALGLFLFLCIFAEGRDARQYQADPVAALRSDAPDLIAAVAKKGADAGKEKNRPKKTAHFRDCPECPEMVVIPAGRFHMGGAVGGGGREMPTREVEIRQSFALGRYEVTVGQFLQFMVEAEYRTDAERQPEVGCYTLELPYANVWGATPRRSWMNLAYEVVEEQPVVCVSLKDVQAYTAWLSEKTGYVYRLPSEAEWEYAARAGSETIYHFGDEDEHLCRYGNVQDETEFSNGGGWADAVGCRDGSVFPTPVGSYAPNSWRLYDTIGNVWEFTADCWNEDFPLGAPNDGGADVSGDCGSRILRGGSWSNAPVNLGSAYRNGGAANSRGDIVGFRVAREMAP